MKLLGLLFLSSAVALQTTDSRFLVWPPARRISVEAGPRWLHESFKFTFDGLDAADSARMEAATERYTDMLSIKSSRGRGIEAKIVNSSSAIRNLALHIGSADFTLDATTDYSYSIDIVSDDETAHSHAPTMYGAIYAMETFVQLAQVEMSSKALFLPHSTVHIGDAPSFNWRGLMIDSGRRFFPVPLVQNLLDTMVTNKLNVLHLHASDECRFGVESKLYPNLTDSLTGIMAGHYTQADITGLISYAADRGIRVVPEFDIPGHSRGFIPIESDGAVFCDPTDADRSQLYGDPQNSTFNVLTSLFSEMTSLFTDDVFHIGCDETNALGPCTVESTFELERQVLNYVQTSLKKTPAGWEEVLFDAGAATQNTTVFAWSRHDPASIVATGRTTVDNNSTHFYFTEPAPAGPAGWDTCWYGIGQGIPSGQMGLLLGGEMSMWSDTYCDIDQCGASSGANPVGYQLFSPQYDTQFSQSIGGMIWPRGYVAAASYWNYNASISASDPAFVQAIWSLNDQIAAQGGLVCPTNCSCDELSVCGVPYIQPTPPGPGSQIMGQPCIAGVDVSQHWIINSGGAIALAGNASLCIVDPGAGTYPLVLGLCSGGDAATWNHPAATAELISIATGDCMDLRASDNAIGTYQCGSGDGLKQLNQEWAADPAAGLIVSLKNGSCLTAVAA